MRALKCSAKDKEERQHMPLLLSLSCILLIPALALTGPSLWLTSVAYSYVGFALVCFPPGCWTEVTQVQSQCMSAGVTVRYRENLCGDRGERWVEPPFLGSQSGYLTSWDLWYQILGAEGSEYEHSQPSPSAGSNLVPRNMVHEHLLEIPTLFLWPEGRDPELALLTRR